MVSEGRIAIGDKPDGPLYAQKKNRNVFGKRCDIYFPRFFHNAPGGPLVNHFYTKEPVFAAPFKAIEVDDGGILRLKWWTGNDKLKAKPLQSGLVNAGNGSNASLKLLDHKLDLSKTHVIEGDVNNLSSGFDGDALCGIVLDSGEGNAQCLLLTRETALFGDIKSDGTDLKILQTIDRSMAFGATVNFRLVIKLDMAELYMNDYLMNLKRVTCNGQIGFIGAGEGVFKNIKVWQSH
jgi:hypothetical protein